MGQMKKKDWIPLAVVVGLLMAATHYWELYESRKPFILKCDKNGLNCNFVNVISR